MADQKSVEEVWLPVIGRSLTRIAFLLAKMNDSTLAERASFLESLGLERNDVATILGTTYQSISEVLSRIKRTKKGKRKNAKKKAR